MLSRASLPCLHSMKPLHCLAMMGLYPSSKIQFSNSTQQDPGVSWTRFRAHDPPSGTSSIPQATL
uniref:Uncharacterized protein n=1 Tax=Rhizophora mucronata TaxID=61149 RepID=A0A2P2Q485_RHIMU